jgi:hypothetical protein
VAVLLYTPGRFIEEKKKAKDKEQSSKEQTAFEREDFLEEKSRL